MPSRSIIININSNENTIQNTDVAAMDSCVSQYGHRTADMSCNFPCDIPCHREGQRALLRYVYEDILQADRYSKKS